MLSFNLQGNYPKHCVNHWIFVFAFVPRKDKMKLREYGAKDLAESSYHTKIVSDRWQMHQVVSPDFNAIAADLMCHLGLQGSTLAKDLKSGKQTEQCHFLI